jgi:hypothetical protein
VTDPQLHQAAVPAQQTLEPHPASPPEFLGVSAVTVHAGFAGAFDAVLQSSLDSVVAGWCRASSLTARTAQIDLAGVTVLDAEGLSCLNRAHALLARAGWNVQLTPPEDIEPRLFFIRAATANDCNWCRGSSSGRPVIC